MILGKKNASGQLKLIPRKAIKTTTGNKKIYVVVNASEKVKNLLATTNKTTFEKAWEDAQEAYAVGADANAAKDGIAALAKNDGTNDIIMMTNDKIYEYRVKENVTYDQALNATNERQNRFSVSVSRVAARVVVTSAFEGNYELYVPNYESTGGEKVHLGTLSGLTYSVAQGERKYYLMRQFNKDKNIITPAYKNVIKGISDYSMMKDYDYSDLNKKDRAVGHTQGLDNDIASPNAVFMLPASHEYDKTGVMDPISGGFRRGNTPYVLVRATFTPDEDAIVDGVKLKKNDTFYVGEKNGLIYGKKENVQDPAYNGFVGQKCRTYLNGKVLYFAYVNPDEPKRAETHNAPVFRNNIYRINITGFSALGYNWNPFFPDGGGFDNPDPNPDKNPVVPSPLKPSDPLFDKNIYMSVDVTVLKWLVHTYDAELGL